MEDFGRYRTEAAALGAAMTTKAAIAGTDLPLGPSPSPGGEVKERDEERRADNRPQNRK